MHGILMSAEFTPGEVTVVLSTFNGSAFLQEQLNSLYAQSYPAARILVRDDGSSDSTRQILQREHVLARIAMLPSRGNLGATSSFFELLKVASETKTEFVAFCDQDDVWRHDKISRAVAALSAFGNLRPVMYCSRLEVVDAGLTSTGFTPLPGKMGFGNALVENVCVGCTIMLNRQALDLVCRHLPQRAPAHDWWCYLVVSCFGEIVFDPDASIQYRQHRNNVFGVATGKLDRLNRNFLRFAGRRNGHRWQSDQAAEFLSSFGDSIPGAQRQLLQAFVAAKSSFWRRARIAMSREFWRQKKLDDLVWRLLVLINRY